MTATPWSLLPPLLAIVLTLVTKRGLWPILCGCRPGSTVRRELQRRSYHGPSRRGWTYQVGIGLGGQPLFPRDSSYHCGHGGKVGRKCRVRSLGPSAHHVQSRRAVGRFCPRRSNLHRRLLQDGHGLRSRADRACAPRLYPSAVRLHRCRSELCDVPVGRLCPKCTTLLCGRHRAYGRDAVWDSSLRRHRTAPNTRLRSCARTITFKLYNPEEQV